MLQERIRAVGPVSEHVLSRVLEAGALDKNFARSPVASSAIQWPSSAPPPTPPPPRPWPAQRAPFVAGGSTRAAEAGAGEGSGAAGGAATPGGRRFRSAPRTIVTTFHVGRDTCPSLEGGRRTWGWATFKRKVFRTRRPFFVKLKGR